MKILGKYIFKEISVFFAICLFVFTGILLTIQILKLSELVISKGVELSQILTVFVAVIPTFLEIAIPMAALLGVMLGFARLSGDSEIVVMRASGISLYKLLSPVICFGILSAGLCFLVSFWLKPIGYQALSQVFFEIARNKTSAGLTAGVFNDLGTLTLYTEEIEYSSGGITKVLIDDRRETDSRKIVIADSGTITSNPSEQEIRFDLRDGSIQELKGEKYSITNFATNSLSVASDDLYDQEENGDRRIREYRTHELRSEIRDRSLKEGEPIPDEKEQERNEKQLTKLKIELSKRYAMPIAALLLALLAMPLGIQPPRAQKTWGVGISTTIGLFVFVLYYGLLSVSVALAESTRASTGIAVWIPNAVTALVMYVAVKNMSTEKWQSTAHAVQELSARPIAWLAGMKRERR
jgi:lipopolysaccharide export system permease protein